MLALRHILHSGRMAKLASWPVSIFCTQACRYYLHPGVLSAINARLVNAKNARLVSAKFARDSIHYLLTTLNDFKESGILFFLGWEQDLWNLKVPIVARAAGRPLEGIQIHSPIGIFA